ncbi:hypothetical protein OIU74_000649 [Salix koriyanagi]|uniref:Uncharacterized protein n=1 Tax=Salix koriyanagi TaxID=2511006 RepID=A0A9Q0X085_9ROSI|nr:hypothetical protein OIU74_000649 [Salix koriyanagi]
MDLVFIYVGVESICMNIFFIYIFLVSFKFYSLFEYVLHTILPVTIFYLSFVFFLLNHSVCLNISIFLFFVFLKIFSKWG